MTKKSLRLGATDWPEAEPGTHTTEKIKELARKFHPETIRIRRLLHRFPELAFEEHQTGELVFKTLRSYDIPTGRGFGKTGLVGVLKGERGDGTVALRADMDALPINEESGVPYSSRNAGIMHACGHDAHMAMLLGAARILSELKHEFRGTVKFLFQPSEEKNPGGAPGMIRDGAISGADVVFGQHITTDFPVGKFAFREGPMMASADELYFNVIGKGGHGAKPHDAVDPIVISAQIITTLQTVISRMKDPLDPSVLTIGSIHGGTATNIIPDSVRLSGTLRTMSEAWRRKALRRIGSTASQVAESLGGKCEVIVSPGYPVLVNSEKETRFARSCAVELFGKKDVVDAPAVMGAEDFAFFLRKVPGTFWWIGAGSKSAGATSSIHSATFRIDETALKHGSAFLAYLAIKYLRLRERDA